MRKIFLKLEKWLSKKYIELYKDTPPEIVYIPPMRGYIVTSISERVFPNMELLTKSLCGRGLNYEYKLGDGWYCRHEFNSLIEDAYNYGCAFTIPLESEQYYSDQELILLRRLAVEGEMNRRKYRQDRGLVDITMS